MRLKQKIGIIGRGFVGSAVEFGFSPNTGCDAEVRVYDKDPSKSLHSLEETVNESDIIFLSVPTPSNKDGSMNLDIVRQVLQDISDVNKVIPGTTRKLDSEFKNVNLIFNPEFLTERSAKFDFINQPRFILGCGDEVMDRYRSEQVADLFRDRFGESIPVIETNYETAELIKYMNNCYFATKVSFLNEMYQISEKSGVDWDIALDGFARDGRIGHSHMNVPGPDGKFGFGGSCFPKDIQAMINYGESLDLNMNTLKGVWNTNLEVRPERDWENLKGRAVVDETN